MATVLPWNFILVKQQLTPFTWKYEESVNDVRLFASVAPVSQQQIPRLKCLARKARGAYEDPLKTYEGTVCSVAAAPHWGARFSASKNSWVGFIWLRHKRDWIFSLFRDHTRHFWCWHLKNDPQEDLFSVSWLITAPWRLITCCHFYSAWRAAFHVNPPPLPMCKLEKLYWWYGKIWKPIKHS